MMRIAIFEDEPAVADNLKEQIEEYGLRSGLSLQTEIYPNGSSAADCGVPDLVFFDCRLPDGSGVAFAQQLKARVPAVGIIFVSAYPEYLFDSYSVKPFRFLLKPVEPMQLRQVLDAYFSSSNEKKPVFVMTDLSVPMDRILYVQTRGNNTSVFTEETVYNSRKNLSEFERELSPTVFLRVHRSCIVNLRWVSSHRDNTVTMSNGQVLRISRRMKQTFLTAFVRYINENR